MYEGKAPDSVASPYKTLTQARRIDLQTGEQTVLSEHTQPVKSVAYSAETSLLISASWDSTLHLHALTPENRLTPTVSTIQLPSKPYSLSLSPSKLVVAMASRAVHIYDLQSLAQLCAQHGGGVIQATPWQERESSMKFQIRAVACMPNDNGYASSSIEGRVAVEWFDPSEKSQSRKYAFKCHRQNVDGEDLVYPVHALAFHPVHGTFGSGGGDGVVALWDAVGKRRIRQYQKFPQSVEAIAFSTDGGLLAVGVSPGIEDDSNEETADYEGKVKIFIRELGEDEAKSKAKK
jgi:cell cycle arrest protein BUB3